MSIHTIAYIINHISTQCMIVYSLSMHPEGSENLLGVFKWIVSCVSHNWPITPGMLLWKHNTPFPLLFWEYSGKSQKLFATGWFYYRLPTGSACYEPKMTAGHLFNWFGACIVNVISVHLKRLRVPTIDSWYQYPYMSHIGSFHQVRVKLKIFETTD